MAQPRRLPRVPLHPVPRVRQEIRLQGLGGAPGERAEGIQSAG